MANRVQWADLDIGVSSFIVQSGPSSAGPWTTLSTITNDTGNANYDATQSVFFFIDYLGSNSTWYVVQAVSAGGTTSSAPFQVGSSYLLKYATVAQVRSYGSIPDTDSQHQTKAEVDALLDGLIGVASETIVQGTGVRYGIDQPVGPALVQATIDLTLFYFNQRRRMGQMGSMGADGLSSTWQTNSMPFSVTNFLKSNTRLVV